MSVVAPRTEEVEMMSSDKEDRNESLEAVSGLNRQLARVDTILASFGYRRTALISVLQDIQSTYRYLPEDMLTYVATALNLSPATVFGVATFYSQFSLEPKGKYIVRVCDGTACHVKSSQIILDAVRKKINIKVGTLTTADGLFTVETVACLGACVLAPVMVINDQVHGQLTPEAAELIINELITRESQAEVSEK